MVDENQEREFTSELMILIRRCIQECSYEPTQYKSAIDGHGGTEAARVLLARISDDSLELSARGRADLTAEALISSEKWKGLFSEEERTTAAARAATFSSDAEISAALVRDIDQAESFFWPEDDLDWFCELVDGIDVCGKLSQMSRWLEAGNSLSVAEGIAYYRAHLIECSDCAGKQVSLQRGIEQLDALTQSQLKALIRNCITSLQFDESMVERLIERENADKKAPVSGPLDGNEISWDDSSWMSESEPHQRWLRLLQLRASQLCAYTGRTIFDYEHTFFINGNPWILWRHADGAPLPISSFIRQLTDDEFLTVLLARNMAVTGLGSSLAKKPVFPTDADLSGIEACFETRETRNGNEWTKILTSNLPRHRVLKRGFSMAERKWMDTIFSMPSELLNLNWGQILYLAFAASTADAPGAPIPADMTMILSALREMHDKVESNSALQIPILDQLEKIVKHLDDRRIEKVMESLRNLLGTQIYDSLSDGARVCIIGAEQVLDPNFADPGMCVRGLCQAFELQMKEVLFTFAKEMESSGWKNYPDANLGPDRREEPQILRNGKYNSKLGIGQIRRALLLGGPVFRDFCDKHSIDHGKLSDALDVVNKYRNHAVHGKPITFVQARLIRDRLLGVPKRDGGIFSAFVR